MYVDSLSYLIVSWFEYDSAHKEPLYHQSKMKTKTFKNASVSLPHRVYLFYILCSQQFPRQFPFEISLDLFEGWWFTFFSMFLYFRFFSSYRLPFSHSSQGSCARIHTFGDSNASREFAISRRLAPREFTLSAIWVSRVHVLVDLYFAGSRFRGFASPSCSKKATIL